MRSRTSFRTTLSSVISSAALLLAPLATSAVDPLHPLGKTTIEAVMGRIIEMLISFTGVLALAMFVWSGFSWMLAAGSADKVKVAKRTMVYAITGLVITFGSYAILRFVLNSGIAEAVK